MRVSHSKKHQKYEVAVVKEAKKCKVQLEFSQGRSGLVKQMPAKTGYLHRFSESVLMRINNINFCDPKN